MLEIFQNHKLAALQMLIIVVSLVALTMSGEHVNEFLRYDRAGLMTGELWRVFTSHMVHANVYHGMINVLAFILVMGFVGAEHSIIRWWCGAAVIALGVTVGLLVFSRNVSFYVGFSGVLHGLLVFGLVMGICRKDKLFMLAMLFVSIKLGREQMPGFVSAQMESLIGTSVIQNAHLYGALVGLVCALMLFVWDRQRGLKARD